MIISPLFGKLPVATANRSSLLKTTSASRKTINNFLIKIVHCHQVGTKYAMLMGPFKTDHTALSLILEFIATNQKLWINKELHNSICCVTYLPYSPGRDLRLNSDPKCTPAAWKTEPDLELKIKPCSQLFQNGKINGKILSLDPSQLILISRYNFSFC